MLEFAEKTYGGLDILVNNAGAGDPPGFPIAHPEVWNAVLDVYLRAPMDTIQYALPLFDKRGGGVTVNIASLAGVGYRAYWWPEYAAAKAAIIRLTAALADLAEQRGVRVNCVAPNWVATEKVLATIKNMTPAQRAEIPELTPPEDIGDAVLEFVRDDSLAGRVMNHYGPGKQRIVAVDSWPD
jgi:NAD(P)-dependent dehydrogenase (short-subunit alcohol dehydrogenase family)